MKNIKKIKEFVDFILALLFYISLPFFLFSVFKWDFTWFLDPKAHPIAFVLTVIYTYYILKISKTTYLGMFKDKLKEIDNM